MTARKHKLRYSVFAASAFAWLTAAGAASAQEVESQEVVVTVERRVQNVQDVAATIQVFSGEELAKLGVNSDFRNLQYVVPGLQITNQEGKLEVFLRGIGSTDSDFSSDPSVAIHYNGGYLARPRGVGPLFFDARRVEVNKGPQGTLRGRNATGGTINIISNEPQFGEFYGSIMAGVGNFASRETETVLNVPLTDRVAVRAALWTRAHDGLYTNAFPGASDDFETPSAQDDIAGRLSLRFEPTDQLSVNLQYAKARVRSSGDPGAFSGRALSAGYDIKDLDDPWNQYFRREGRYEADLDTFVANVAYDFGAFGVEYNGSFNGVDAYNKNASREWQLGQVYPGSAAEAAAVDMSWNDTFFQGEKSESVSHELRFFSASGARLQWTAGAFRFEEDYDYLSWDVGNGYCGDSDWFAPGTISCWQNGLGGENRGDGSSVTSTAFYADGSFAVTDNFRIKAGVRWTKDEKVQNDSNAQYQFVINEAYFNSYPGFSAFNDLTIGGQGFRLTAPGARPNRDPVVCQNWSLATLTCEGGVAPLTAGAQGLQFFLQGIQQFGLSDTWGKFFTDCAAANQCWAFVRSDFATGVERSSVEHDYVNWRLGFEYDLDADRMVYATASTGTRSGGINRPVTLSDGSPLNSTWEPEELTVYEAGSKNVFDLNGTRLRLNGAVFYYDYKNKVIQNLVDVPIFVPGNPSAVTQQVVSDNAANARVFGVEIDGDLALPARLTFGWNLLYLNSELKDSKIYDPRTGLRDVDVSGNRLPNTSEWNANLRLSQVNPVNWGAVTSFDWTVNVLYRSDYYLTPFNNKGYAMVGGNIVEVPLSTLTPNNNGRLSSIGGPANGNFLRDDVSAFFIVNLNAGLELGDEGRFRLDGWVENATNQAFSGKGFVNNSVNIRYLNSPRMFGVRLRARF